MRIHDWYRARSDESGSTSPLTDGQTTAVPPGHRPGRAPRVDRDLPRRRARRERGERAPVTRQTREFPGARGRRLARARRLAGGVGHEPAI